MGYECYVKPDKEWFDKNIRYEESKTSALSTKDCLSEIQIEFLAKLINAEFNGFRDIYCYVHYLYGCAERDMKLSLTKEYDESIESGEECLYFYGSEC